MQLDVLLFAAAREAAGTDRLQIAVGESANAAEVFSTLSERSPELAALLPSCRLAVDGHYVAGDAVITPDSEIALIPPVSGG